MRKLPQYSQFNIVVSASAYGNGFHTSFTDTDGKLLPDYKARLTPSQWQKASLYLDRKLIPFCGYTYTVKPEYAKIEVYKIR